MKNLLLLISLTFLMVACGPDYKKQAEDLSRKNDSLIAIYDQKSTELTGYMQDLGEVQASIADLTQREQLLKTKSESTMNASVKSQILADLDAIRLALAENKKKLSQVQAKLKKSNSKIAELEKMISGLTKDIENRDASLADMSQKLNELTTKISNVETEMAQVKSDNAVKTQEIADKTVKLNTAYYTVGTYKSLREKKVISNDGFLFKSKTVDPNFSADSFTKIDITSTKTINLIGSKEIAMASTHPTGSYKLVKEKDKITSLEVVDPDKFWASSKYLVIVTK